ncbi:MAG: U32 family peptidase [Gammaproteobacteria bacterium]|nr:U32 family peptidase [Gammaproteobacteria bacterium]
MELICPAGSMPALQTAVDEGADAVYIGFRDDTNARHFPGLNFNGQRAQSAVHYAHNAGVKLFVAINTFPQPAGWSRWTDAVDHAVDLGVDALILADIGVLAYACERYPHLALHLSVQSSATNCEALKFYQKHFGIRRAVLPRVLSLDQIKQVAANSPVDIEVFGFGSLCIMAEGRCFLSSYVTAESPNTSGACSPAKAVQWEEKDQVRSTRLGKILIDRYAPNESAGYPTLCKGRFIVNGQTYNALEEPTSLNTLELLPELRAAGVKAIKLEGRQRSPIYVKQVVKVWRQALDTLHKEGDTFTPRVEWMQQLAAVSEGSQTTFGAYSRPWQ